MADSTKELSLKHIVQLNDLCPGITLSQIYLFIRLARQLKNDIVLVQPASESELLTSQPARALPPSIKIFLQKACEIPYDYVDGCWDILKEHVWYASLASSEEIEKAFSQHGHGLGLTFQTLYPPQHTCTNTSCSRNMKGQLLTKAEQRQVVLYTLSDGAIPAYSVHLYCESCNVNYHHDYRVVKNRRIYYDGIPDILQVGEHQFVERRLIELWITSRACHETSATNCARLYNLTLSQKAPPSGWDFGFTLRTEHVWDSFTILSLLEDFSQRQKTLTVPHLGLQKDRYTEAVKARNILWVVVIDGVTVGHPCCAVHNCHIPLGNNRHRFCPVHMVSQNHICAIVGCEAQITPESLTCADPGHRAVEKIHQERGQARFQLKERMKRAQVAHPNDALAEEPRIADINDGEELGMADVDDELEEEEFEVEGSQGEAHRTSNTKKTKIRAQFGRKRTHNEQIIVAPCGMIIARETFYGVEGVASVVEMIKRAFHGDIKPDHIFFDNNCTLAKMVKEDPFFDDIGLTIDVFHFNCKHSETDIFCQQHCNPAAYPELASTDGKGWYFNSSIAEQTNVWFGGYHAICREMLVDRYNFFLDEMILRRNRATRAKLLKSGKAPMIWPTNNMMN
ncbi:hypothetical protein BD779DRAFT_1610685 [Infundibulicybe gibba]|nr:hypothetical protein BD779DRAFT_1610685 [Infundibulicybe gibba]